MTDAGPTADLAAWREVLRTPGLRHAATAVPDPNRPTPAQLATLRKLAGSQQAASIALELAATASKARENGIVADRSGHEQASGPLEAAHKAARFAAAIDRRDSDLVLDLCAGIGADTRALRSALPDAVAVVAVDLDPVRSLLCRHNAPSAAILRADATQLPFDLDAVRGALVHVDPARREERGGRGRDHRDHTFAGLRPSIGALEPILVEARGAAVKLGPGIDHDTMPNLGTCQELEILGGPTRSSGLKQAVWWLGDLARFPGERTATRLTSPPLSFHAVPRPLADAVQPPPRVAALAPGQVVLIPDAALERAGLVGALLATRDLRVHELHPGLGLLVTDAPPVDDPWFEAFEVKAFLPWRVSKVAAWLRAHDGGEVTLRTRGHAVPNADRVAARELSGKGSCPYTVLALRFGPHKVTAAICRSRTEA